MISFNEQLKNRHCKDDELFSDAFKEIAFAIDSRNSSISFSDSYGQLTNSMSAVLEFYRLKITDEGDENQSITERFERAFRTKGIMYRAVRLKRDFYKTTFLPMITTRRSDDKSVALIPSSLGGYHYTDEAGVRHKVDKNTFDQVNETAYVFYKPLPGRTLSIKDILVYAISILTPGDCVSLLCSFFFSALIGLLIPHITKLLFSEVIVTGKISLLYSLGFLAICVTVSSALLEVIKELFTNRINTKVSSCIESATMMRLLSLPVSFFKEYNSGDLNARLLQLSRLASSIFSLLISAGTTIVFSVIYIIQIFAFSRELSKIVLLILLLQIFLSVWTMSLEKKQSLSRLESLGKENSLSFTILSGIEKIRLSGAEKRMFALWGNSFAKRLRTHYHPPLLLSILPALSVATSAFGTVFLYKEAVKYGVSVADYYAFNSAFSMISSAFIMLGSTLKGSAGLGAILDNVAPIFKAKPECDESKELPDTLKGNLELSHVTFSYEDSQIPIINDFSLKIESGQYVAIVGKSGCGKSTLIRLMLGFEKPNNGAVYYDGHNASTVDMRFVRRQIGLVMQDSCLLHESILDNITLSNPRLTEEDAWHAAKLANIDEDIKNMPMQMQTIIGEGSSGISGGQKQRLLIARAVVGNPNLLIFDEATSALDNIAQQQVSHMLDNLNCTRIVVAHRLSTIRLCDRILVMDKGKIVEDGTYDELIKADGLFSKLVANQQLNA